MIQSSRTAAVSDARPPGRWIAIAGLLAFFIIGELQAVYGPSLPSLRERYAVSAPGAALVLTAHFGSSVIAILLFGALGALALRVRLIGAALSVAIGAGLLGWAADWYVVVGAAAILGLGYGGLVVELNTYFARAFGRRSGALVALLNGTWGVGASIGPLALGAQPLVGLQRVELASAAGALLVALVFVRVVEESASKSDDEHGVASRGSRRAVLIGFVLLLFLYAAIENAIGAWETTYLESVHIDPADARRAPALFWGALTVGRLLTAPVSLHVRPRSLVAGAFVVSGLSVALATFRGGGLVGCTLAGLSLAPVFPSAIVWLVSELPSMRKSTSPAIAAACVGGATMPPLVGRVLDATRQPLCIPLTIAAAIAAAIAVTAWLRSVTNPSSA